MNSGAVDWLISSCTKKIWTAYTSNTASTIHLVVLCGTMNLSYDLNGDNKMNWSTLCAISVCSKLLAPADAWAPTRPLSLHQKMAIINAGTVE